LTASEGNRRTKPNKAWGGEKGESQLFEQAVTLERLGRVWQSNRKIHYKIWNKEGDEGEGN